MKKIKQTKVMCNNLSSFFEAYGFGGDIVAVQNDLYDIHKADVIKFDYVIDYLVERKMVPTVPREMTRKYEAQLESYDMAIFE